VPLSDLWPVFRDRWILHEDADIIVLDKPAGIPTHAPDPSRTDDVVTRLTAHLRARGDERAYLGTHQRLDQGTSGVLLFTRRKEANAAIAEQFEKRRAMKTYVACLEASPKTIGRTGEVVLRHRLAPDKDGLMRALPPGARGGQEAVTRVRVLKHDKNRSLVELRPETGRTHQIRVQLAAIGAPIAGDVDYGGPPATRLLLHASELGIKHPSGGRMTTFRAPLPEVFGAWLEGRGGPISKGSQGSLAIERALREAAERRYGIATLPQTTAFRIANGEGDGIGGVAVDVYGDYLVVSISSEEAEGAREAILDAAGRLGARGVYVKVRPKHASVIVDSRRGDLAPKTAVRGESAPESFCIHELGLPFEVRLGDGLSTGIFLDQRENRRRVRDQARGKRVLNLFAYTGAFSVAAAAGGALETATVDVSKSVLEWARRNLDAIGADAKSHALIEADALVWLKSAARGKDRYDLVILDPPSFATTKQTRFSAANDYRSVAALAMGVIAPGGRLLASTNHRGIVRAKLRRYLHEAARDAGRTVTQMKDLPDSLDFPPEPGREPAMKSVLVTLGDPR
jgi:23S rRNA (cytosine1962-C5)-methyltransferase